MKKYSACNPAVMAVNDYFYGDPLQKRSSENLGNIIKYSIVTELLEKKEELPLQKQAYLKGFTKTLNKIGVIDKRVIDTFIKVAFFIEMAYEEGLEKGASVSPEIENPFTNPMYGTAQSRQLADGSMITDPGPYISSNNSPEIENPPPPQKPSAPQQGGSWYGNIGNWFKKNPWISTLLAGLIPGLGTGLVSGNWGAGLGAGIAGAGAGALGLNYAGSDWKSGMGADLYNKATGLA